MLLFICNSKFNMLLYTYKAKLKYIQCKIEKVTQNFNKFISNVKPNIIIFAIVIFVSQINFNQYIIKIISFVAPLTFDVYLIHDNPYIRNNYIRNLFNKESIDLNLASLIFLIIQKTFIIFLICIYIAYIRSKIFSIFKIKLLCCYIELLIIKII